MADNLVANGTFDNDISGWQQYAGEYAIEWDGGAGSAAPGSMRMVTGTSLVNSGVAQCVELRPSTLYTMQGRFFVPSSSPSLPQPGLQIQWFYEPSCIDFGEVVGTLATPFDFDTWTTTSRDVVSPPGALSGRLALSVRNTAGSSMELLYDDIVLDDRSGVFQDDFEDGATGAWSNTVP